MLEHWWGYYINHFLSIYCSKFCVHDNMDFDFHSIKLILWEFLTMYFDNIYPQLLTSLSLYFEFCSFPFYFPMEAICAAQLLLVGGPSWSVFNLLGMTSSKNSDSCEAIKSNASSSSTGGEIWCSSSPTCSILGFVWLELTRVWCNLAPSVYAQLFYFVCKYCFLEVINHLWFLQHFASSSTQILEPFGGRGVVGTLLGWALHSLFVSACWPVKGLCVSFCLLQEVSQLRVERWTVLWV